MFVALKPLLAQCQSLSLILTTEANGAIAVTVIPKAAEKDAGALAQPLQLTGTAEELDEGFVAAISSFSASRQSLKEQVDATNAILEQARKDTASKPSKATGKAGSAKASGKSAPSMSEEDEEEEESPCESTSSSAGGTPAAETPVAPEVNLFS